ncbi:4-hydroxy-3-methylbut-2-enyl diphosphate reductase [Lentimicrobium sp. S6]|uniref:4-hydroxy-3-methylbut-2-enyl diphosphate reductase n=1 Tax=Lentimicrobium sp. S6 TaxID=2735872 RepID=UPI0015572367|nr:4-hydroxy-3-methylbut-2-enyl diphosphate reductase [Lentimicrobium sp. S6]NPD45840.1 4-hydroxy-3-methylbut-2-enyl diphosphate reductase [Lentimicrobium sp. S6]
MKIEIDPGAGPCFGVEKAIEKAEFILKEKSVLYTVGDLIHNESEVERLEKLGMKTIAMEQAISGDYPNVLFRAHGEPPSSYDSVKKAKVEVEDATCPIVVSLQKKIAKTFSEIKDGKGQIVLFGKKRHPEVISLMGHCDDKAIVIANIEELELIDFSIPIYLFSQTTKYRSEYYLIKEKIEKKLDELNLLASSQFSFNDSSCKIVARRDEQLRNFVEDKDLIIFVSGTKSSNGRQLFQICKNTGIETYFISRIEDLNREWFVAKNNIGISGATSTPKWLLEEMSLRVKELVSES